MHVMAVFSLWELVTRVSEYIVRMSQEKAREARMPREVPVLQLPHAVQSVSSPVLVEVRAPELTCTIRRPRDASGVALVTFYQTLSPDIEDEYWALASQLPALEPPLRKSYATEAEWLADCGAHLRTWDAWREVYPADWRNAYNRACDRQRALAEAREQPRKKFTVAVGLDGKVQRVPKKVMKGIRAAETWRFDPERRSPLEEALANDKPIIRLKAKGKFEEAAALEASTSRLVAQMERWPAVVQQRRQDRSPWAMKALWIELGVTRKEDVRFELVLRLSQERMIACSPEIAISPRSDGLYSVNDVVRILAGETEGLWTLTRDWLDDRMKAGRLPYALDAHGWKCLDEHGLQCARKLIKGETLRKDLVGYQTKK